MLDGERQAGAEFEITRAMIVAGAAELRASLSEYVPDDWAMAEQVALGVLEAAARSQETERS